MQNDTNSAIQAVLNGRGPTDAVISTLGHSKGSPDDVLAVASSNVVTAMRNSHVKRLVVLANTTLPDSGDHPTFGQRMQRTLMGMMMGQINRDHATQAQHITASGLDWTIVRAATLTNGLQTGKYRVGRPVCYHRLRSDNAASNVSHALVSTYSLGRVAGLAYS